jgi:hypothetical protein
LRVKYVPAPPSILEIARQLSVNPETLRCHFPEEIEVGNRPEILKELSGAVSTATEN